MSKYRSDLSTVVKQTINFLATNTGTPDANIKAFDYFITQIDNFTHCNASTILEIKQRQSRKRIGDIWELFCKYYLLIVKKVPNVWLLSELPTDIAKSLDLSKTDWGIDLVARNKNGKYIAIQAKYRRSLTGARNKIAIGNSFKRRDVICWRELSTFYSLCLRTGPWYKYLVMTNVKSVRRQGKRQEEDLSICQGSFRKITYANWYDISQAINANVGGTTNNQTDKIPESAKPDLESIRNARLKRFA